MNHSLLLALMLVESGNQADAIGDNGRAIGCLQITRACVRDVNRIYGTRYRWPDDCFNRYLSGRICEQYLIHWCGPDASPEVLARTWNAGPSGHKQKASLKYWRKVKKNLK